MRTPVYYPLIHNEWVKTHKTFKVYNPFNGDTLAKVYLAERDFLDMAVESTAKGFHSARKFSGFERFDLLLKIANGIEKNHEMLAQTIMKESGKPIKFARSEVSRAHLTFTWAAEESRRLSGELLPLDVSPQTKGYYGLTRRFPKGIVLGISPFNFPLNLIAHKIAPAIASGNSILLKPASATPLTALKLGEIIKNAGAPPGMINIIPSSGKNAEMLVKDGRIKKLSFTGSAQLGWYLKSIAGKKSVTLELGGNAAVIIEPSVDLGGIIPRLVSGSFAYAGQICIAIQRIYVRDTLFDQFISEFVTQTKKSAKMGDPARDDTMVGPMINVDAAKTAESWIREAEKNGAKIILGGKRKNNFLEPTVLTNTSPDMKVVCEEIFAPVVSIEAYHEFEDAINMVNKSHYGLQAGLFTNDIRQIQHAYQSLEIGGLIVNDYPTFRIDPMPYGGFKDSGFGREGIRYAIEEMTELKLLVINGGP